MSRGNPRITIRLTPRWLEDLAAIAQQDEKTVSEVIRDAIIAYLRKRLEI